MVNKLLLETVLLALMSEQCVVRTIDLLSTASGIVYNHVRGSQPVIKMGLNIPCISCCTKSRHRQVRAIID